MIFFEMLSGRFSKLVDDEGEKEKEQVSRRGS